MSHAATTWAIQQRGLKPTTKIVLWHLCDRFNPDYGCFPSQDRLAHDCEISRSTLNDHLGQLEAAGLLRRVPRIDSVTKRQLPTRYILGFEPGFTPVGGAPCPNSGHGWPGDAEGGDDVEPSIAIDLARHDPCPEFGHGISAEAVSDFGPEPCPENAESRVRIPDTNLVREPLREPVKEEEAAQARQAVSDRFFATLLDALGLDAAALPCWWQGWPPRLHVQRWRDDLGLTEAEIIATAKASRQEHPEPPDGPKALDRAMQRAALRKRQDGATRTAWSQGGQGGSGGGGGGGAVNCGNGSGSLGTGGRRDWATGVRAGTTSPLPAPRDAATVAAFYAALVNSDRYLPTNAISNRIRDALLAHGLVTPERLRERGLW